MSFYVFRVCHLCILLCISYLHFYRVCQMGVSAYHLLCVFILIGVPSYHLGCASIINRCTIILLDYHLAALCVLAREVMGWNGIEKMIFLFYIRANQKKKKIKNLGGDSVRAVGLGYRGGYTPLPLKTSDLQRIICTKAYHYT